MDFIIQLLRTVFYSLDSIVYSLIPNVYALLIQITRTSIFTQPEIHKFSLRVYELIGVFMLFKVTVSVVNYILNPDDFSDKEKGFTNIIKRIILSLVMLVLAPFVFQEAFNLQAVILEENTIMNLVFGTPPTPAEIDAGSSERSSNSSYVDMAGRKIQFTLMYAFAQPNYQEFSGSNFDLMNCENTYAKDEDNNYDFRMSSITNDKSKFIYQLEPDCWGVYDPDTDAYVNDGTNGKLMQLFEENDAEAAYQNYAQGVAQQSFSLFFRKEVITAKSEDGRYFVNYRFGISTAVGVATLYMFLMFCIDIAVRSIQWGFLQMISPIPILSYCDPKSSKDGMFKKWLDKCKKVYLDLFIRLFALYFGIYIITLIGTFRDVVTGEEISMMDNWILSIFMILGVLMFVKKLPDFLKETLALDGSGMFKGYLNPFKKIEDEAVGGKLISGAAKGAVAGTAAGAAAFGSNLVATKGNIFSAAAGAVSASTKGLWHGLNGKKIGESYAKSYGAAIEARKRHRDMKDQDVNPFSVGMSKLQQKLGITTGGQFVEAANDYAKKVQSSYDSMMNAAKGNDTASFDATINGQTRTFKGMKDLAKFQEQMAKSVVDRSSFQVKRSDYANDEEGTEKYNEAVKQAEKDYQDAVAKYQKTLNDIDDAMKKRLDSIASGAATITTDDRAANAGIDATFSAIRDGYKQMKGYADAANATIHKVASEADIASINTNLSASVINGQSKGMVSGIGINEEAARATRTDSFARKDSKK